MSDTSVVRAVNSLGGSNELPQLDIAGFKILATIIGNSAGINLTPDKRLMVQTRLMRRLRALGMTNFTEYVHLVTTATQRELPHLLDAVTTNKTEFFRERPHFDHLIERAFGQWKTDAPIRVLSAGCSSGEEPYSIAMCAREALGKEADALVQVFAGDISQIKLAEARRGVYAAHGVAHLGRQRLARHFLRGQNQCEGQVKVRPEIASLVTFERINLIHPVPWEHRFHAIFCCNVAIYFDAGVQATVFRHFYNALRPGGLLFIGHAETLRLAGDLPFHNVRIATYVRG